MPLSLRRAALAALVVLVPPTVAHAQAQRAGLRFEITFARAAHAEPITGRVYVALSRTSDARNMPIAQTGETGVPLFGVDVEQLAAGVPAIIDAATFGYP